MPAYASGLMQIWPFGRTSNHPGDLAPATAQIWGSATSGFSQLKSPLKAKRFQTVNEFQENMLGQLMETEKTV